METFQLVSRTLLATVISADTPTTWPRLQSARLHPDLDRLVGFTCIRLSSDLVKFYLRSVIEVRFEERVLYWLSQRCLNFVLELTRMSKSLLGVLIVWLPCQSGLDLVHAKPQSGVKCVHAPN
jgi:hypothetical protein